LPTKGTAKQRFFDPASLATVKRSTGQVQADTFFAEHLWN